MPDTERVAEAERLATLFRQYCEKVRSFARRRVGAEAAQEIVAETFLVAWRRIDVVPEPALPWLYKVASFEIANYRRRQERDSRLETALTDFGTGRDVDSSAGGGDDLSRAVSDAFAELRPQDQEILRLAAWEQLSSGEGALVVGCTITAYRMRLHRARVRLARKAGLWGDGYSIGSAEATGGLRRHGAPEVTRSHGQVEGTEVL